MRGSKTICGGCGVILPKGRQYRCVLCVQTYNQAYIEKNQEALKVKRLDAYRQNPKKFQVRAKTYRKKNLVKIREREKQAYADNRFRRRVQAACWRRGITYDQYLTMYREQNASCRICKMKHKEGDKLLCVDHDHQTGEARSLLCAACNAGIGMFRESPMLLKEAIRYLRAVKR